MQGNLFGLAGLVITVLIQVITLAVVITRIKDKADTLAQSDKELKDGQTELQSAVTKLVTALSEREIVEGRYDERIRHLQSEVENLREWRHRTEQSPPTSDRLLQARTLRCLDLLAKKLGMDTGLSDLLTGAET